MISEDRSRGGPEGERGKKACEFCKVVRGEAESYIILEDELSLGFLDRRPLFPGHSLLVTRTHYETLAELPQDLISPVFGSVQLLALAVVKAMGADGSFIAINNHVSQSVPHLHVHVVPRKLKDGLKGFFWPRQPYKSDELALQTQRAIRSAVAELRSGSR